MRRRGRPKLTALTAVGRAYLDMIRATMTQPPKLTSSDVARITHDLAQPRQPVQGDLFAPRRQGR